MNSRRIITISLPPPLLKKADEVAQEENRTRSELLREALRLYVETREVRKRASREQLFAMISQAQARAKNTPSREVRRMVEKAIQSIRSGKASSRA